MYTPLGTAVHGRQTPQRALVERLRVAGLPVQTGWTPWSGLPVAAAVSEPLTGADAWALWQALRDRAVELEVEPVCLSAGFFRERVAEGYGEVLLRGRPDAERTAERLRAASAVSLDDALPMLPLDEPIDAVLPEIASLRDVPGDGRDLPYGWPRPLSGCRVAVFASRLDEIPVLLGLGADGRTTDEAHAAVLRAWHDRYDARLLQVIPDGLTFWVGEPPHAGEELVRVAGEQLLYAPNLALHTFVSPLCTEGGTPLADAEHHLDTLGYAAMLRSHVWHCWW